MVSFNSAMVGGSRDKVIASERDCEGIPACKKRTAVEG